MMDGSRGQAGRPHKRLVPAAYADGKGIFYNYHVRLTFPNVISH